MLSWCTLGKFSVLTNVQELGIDSLGISKFMRHAEASMVFWLLLTDGSISRPEITEGSHRQII